MFTRIYDACDASTIATFSATGIHFATVSYDIMLSRIAGVIAIVIGIGKLVEMFTGHKVSSFFKRKGKQ